MTMNWENADERIHDMVIDKCRSSELRTKLLIKGTHLTLGKVREIARSFEDVDIHLKTMSGVEKVNRDEHRESTDQFKGGEARGRCFCCNREGHLVLIDVVQKERPSVRSAIS